MLFVLTFGGVSNGLPQLVPNPKAFPVSGRKSGQKSSEPYVQIGAHRPGLTRQNQAVPYVVGLENIARRHFDLTPDDGRHAGSAATLPARVGHFNALIDQQVDQALATRPEQPMPPTVEVDLHVRNFCHAPMVRDRQSTACPHAQWPGQLDRNVR
jgi:hypothetical protein